MMMMMMMAFGSGSRRIRLHRASRIVLVLVLVSMMMWIQWVRGNCLCLWRSPRRSRPFRERIALCKRRQWRSGRPSQYRWGRGWSRSAMTAARLLPLPLPGWGRRAGTSIVRVTSKHRIVRGTNHRRCIVVHSELARRKRNIQFTDLV